MIHRTTAFTLVCLATLVSNLHAADAPKAPDYNEQYVLGPDSKPQEGVPKGTLTKLVWKESKNFPGTIHDYTLYVPAQYDDKTPACVFVCQDNVQYNAPVVFDNLIAKKQMPVTIGIFISPGYFPPKEGEPAKTKDGKPNNKSNRSVEYDSLGDTYAKFLLEEIMPEVAKKYKLTDKPEGRCIAGDRTARTTSSINSEAGRKPTSR